MNETAENILSLVKTLIQSLIDVLLGSAAVIQIYSRE